MGNTEPVIHVQERPVLVVCFVLALCGEAAGLLIPLVLADAYDRCHALSHKSQTNVLDVILQCTIYAYIYVYVCTHSMATYININRNMKNFLVSPP